MNNEAPPFPPKRKYKKKVSPSEESIKLISLDETKRNEKGQFLPLAPGEVSLPRGKGPGSHHVWSTKGGLSAERYALVRLSRENHMEYFNVLQECMRDNSEKWMTRITAAKWLLEFGFGKAPQALNITDDREKNADGDLKTYTRAELGSVFEKQRSDRAMLMQRVADMQRRMEVEGDGEESTILNEPEEKVINEKSKEI